MIKKQNTQKSQDLELLWKFKDAVRTWKNTHSSVSRSEINNMMHRVRKILAMTASAKYVTLDAPLAMGGQRIVNNANALDLLFDCPFNMDVSDYVIDSCDMAIGVLSHDKFEYPNEIKKEESVRKFDEDDIALFESLINQGEEILERYNSEKEEDLVNSKEFNDEYDQWRTDTFRLFETHFDFKKETVFQEIWQNYIFITKKRNEKYVEIILRAMKACYRMPYKHGAKKGENMKATNGEGSQPININIHNENKQSQNQSQDIQLFVELLKQSLAPYQLDELKEIAAADVPVPEKRKNLLQKIMSFGESFGASVLANILTNPQIIGLL